MRTSTHGTKAAYPDRNCPCDRDYYWNHYRFCTLARGHRYLRGIPNKYRLHVKIVSPASGGLPQQIGRVQCRYGVEIFFSKPSRIPRYQSTITIAGIFFSLLQSIHLIFNLSPSPGWFFKNGFQPGEKSRTIPSQSRAQPGRKTKKFRAMIYSGHRHLLSLFFNAVHLLK